MLITRGAFTENGTSVCKSQFRKTLGQFDLGVWVITGQTCQRCFMYEGKEGLQVFIRNASQLKNINYII